MKTPTCTYHCSYCGRHFHSLLAFDYHRVGDYAEPIGSEDGRRCLSPIEVLDTRGRFRLEIWATGVCRMGGDNRDGSARSGDRVPIWTTAGLAERREQLAGLSGLDRTALPASSDDMEGNTL